MTPTNSDVKTHVEGHAATLMEERGWNVLEITINNANGVCAVCNSQLPGMLNGRTLVVKSPQSASIPYNPLDPSTYRYQYVDGLVSMMGCPPTMFLSVSDFREDRQDLLDLWYDGATLDFSESVGIGQSWIDDLVERGSLERCKFFRTSFEGRISFAGVAFKDADCGFRACRFADTVTFSGAIFAGSGGVDFSEAQFEGDADFTDVRFGSHSCSWRRSTFFKDVRFDRAVLAKNVDLGAEFKAYVSFQSTRFGSDLTRFADGQFWSRVDLGGRVPPGAILDLGGLTIGPEAAVNAARLKVEGRVWVTDTTPDPLAALASPPTRGAINRFNGPIEAIFEAGPLAGGTYEIPEPSSIVRLLWLMGGSHEMRLQRTDTRFEVECRTDGATLFVREQESEDTAAAVLELGEAGGKHLREIMLRMDSRVRRS